jgi:methionyl-tRNA formyltransferase
MMIPARPGIVFMGTPEFAVESLKAVIGAGYTVKGVVTSQDKPSGRGLQLRPSPVKVFALENNIPILQPLKLKDPDFLEALRNWNADLQVIVAFRMLPEEVWSMPRLGTFNLHASLLPQYRGAAPINWAVMNGEMKTGVTTFFLNHEIDKGSVIYQEEIIISPDETAGDIHDRLMTVGADLVVRTIEGIGSGNVSAIDQHLILNTSPLRSAPKLFKSDCKIDWSRDSISLYNFIRGLSPHPAAWSDLITREGEALKVKIFFARPVIGSQAGQPGTTASDNRGYLHVSTGDGIIAIERIQLEGKKQMTTPEFLNGFSIAHCRFQ